MFLISGHGKGNLRGLERVQPLSWMSGRHPEHLVRAASPGILSTRLVISFEPLTEMKTSRLLILSLALGAMHLGTGILSRENSFQVADR